MKAVWTKKTPGDGLDKHVVKAAFGIGAIRDWQSLERVLKAIAGDKRGRRLGELLYEGQSVLSGLLMMRAPMSLLQLAIDLGAPVGHVPGTTNGAPPLLLAAGLGPACQEASLLFSDDVEPSGEGSDAESDTLATSSPRATSPRPWHQETAWDVSRRLDFRPDAVAALIAAGADPFAVHTETGRRQDNHDSSARQDICASYSLLSLAILAGAQETVAFLTTRPEALKHPESLAISLKIGYSLQAGLDTETALDGEKKGATEAANAAKFLDTLVRPGEQGHSAALLRQAGEMFRALEKITGRIALNRDLKSVANCLTAHLNSLEQMSFSNRPRRQSPRLRVSNARFQR